MGERVFLRVSLKDTDFQGLYCYRVVFARNILRLLTPRYNFSLIMHRSFMMSAPDFATLCVKLHTQSHRLHTLQSAPHTPPVRICDRDHIVASTAQRTPQLTPTWVCAHTTHATVGASHYLAARVD